MKIGDIVEAKSEHSPLCCGSGIYEDAIIISVDPFIFVSRSSDMRWSCYPAEKLKVTGIATEEQIRICMRRIDK